MIHGVLIDLSGVLYIGEQAIPGAASALQKLTRAGIPHRFVTNVSRKTASEILTHLRTLGFTLAAKDLVTTPHAARVYLKQHKLRPYLLVHPNIYKEFSELVVTNPNAVLVGDAEDRFNYRNLNQAFRLLMDGAELISLGDNRYFREDTELSLDIGPFVHALRYAADVPVTVLGKPARDFFHAAVNIMGCQIENVVMIGDDATTDVEGALSAGLQAILVRTGKYRPNDEDQIVHAGGLVVNDIVQAVDLILDNQAPGKSM